MDKWEYQNKPCHLENHFVREPCKQRTACIFDHHHVKYGKSFSFKEGKAIKSFSRQLDLIWSFWGYESICIPFPDLMILLSLIFISMRFQTIHVIITIFFLQQGSTLCTGVRGEGHQRGDLSSFNAVCLAISWLFLTINDRNWPKFLLSPVSTLWKLIWKQQYNKQRWDLLITPNPAMYG